MSEKFIKDDAGKPSVTSLSPHWLSELVRHSTGGSTCIDLIETGFLRDMGVVLKYGKDRYGAYNWQLCEELNRYLDAAHRHLMAILRGELVDPDTGIQHAAHLAVNAMFIHHFLEPL